MWFAGGYRGAGGGKSAAAGCFEGLIETRTAESASVSTVWANAVGEGTAKAAVVGCGPRGTLPVMITLTAPSGLVTGSEISRSGLEAPGPVITWLMNLM